MGHNYRLGSDTSSDISVVQTKLAFILSQQYALFLYIPYKMLLPGVQILKSDVVLQLADIEIIFLFYFMI